MDLMKVFDQTVREIKREVNLKVLKVPEIEQKVLDATDDAPWGPHGTALAEIAQATKKFTECQMVMNVLWTRLGEIGKDWRLVYKALAVIEYLVSHGSERAVDEIIEHTFQISALTSFEYAEPSGKDVGLNVRKKAETIVSLLNNKEKIQDVRNKAAANRDKYVGLSSSGITYKSGSASHSSFQSSDRYGGISSTRESGSYYEKDPDSYVKSGRGGTSDSRESTLKKGSPRTGSKDHDRLSSNASKSSKSSAKLNSSDKKKTVPSQISSNPASSYDDDFDDFDPRGTSSSKSSAETSKQPDLFAPNLLDDFMDAPGPVPVETSVVNNNSTETDLFADAAFVSAPAQVEKVASSQPQEVDLFAAQPAAPSAVPSTMDFFSAPDPVVQPVTTAPKADSIDSNFVDPFATVPLNTFDGSDVFGGFSSSSNTAPPEPTQSPVNDSSVSNLNGKKSSANSSSQKGFQVKSGIWADSLSRGLIDLNISAPKKVSLVDVGVVGHLSEGSDEKEKGHPASFYMGRAMGAGSGLGRSGFTPPQQEAGGADIFSNLGGQQYNFGGFQK